MSQPIVDEKINDKKIPLDVERASVSSFGKGDILSLENTDPILNAKMHLISDVSAAYCAFFAEQPEDC